MVGLKAALDFFHTIGPERIYGRIHQQSAKINTIVKSHPQLQVTAASRDDFYGGLLSFTNTKGDLDKVAAECGKRAIRIAGGGPRMRIATHIFTLQPEINAFADAVDAGLRA